MITVKVNPEDNLIILSVVCLDAMVERAPPVTFLLHNVRLLQMFKRVVFKNLRKVEVGIMFSKEHVDQGVALHNN